MVWLIVSQWIVEQSTYRAQTVEVMGGMRRGRMNKYNHFDDSHSGDF